LADRTGISFFKVARWIILILLIGVIVFMLKRPPAPAQPLTPAQVKEQAQHFENKLQQIETARQSGSSPDPESTTFMR
jgi:hypothetical protein